MKEINKLPCGCEEEVKKISMCKKHLDEEMEKEALKHDALKPEEKRE